MYRPPDPRDRSGIDQPSWQAVGRAYAMMAAVVLSLWAVSNPLAGAGVLAAVVGLYLIAPRAAAVTRCLRVCREFTFHLGGSVRVTVTRTGVEDGS